MKNNLIRKIHHVGLSVADLDKAMAFYVDLLGFEVKGQFDWSGSPEIDLALGLSGSEGRGAMIEFDGFSIELFEYESPEPKPALEPRAANYGWTHICVMVDDAKLTMSELKKAGVEFHHTCIDIGDGPFAYARDPFGNIVEIWEQA